ncbi:MAG: YgcG family protein, partial [Candidatus Accumulibacter sp.]|nr:YgcG family protein [Accumulibacter sp.]
MSTSRRLSRLPGWLLSLLLFACSLAVAEQPIPPLAAHVTDLTGTLAGDQEATLDAKLAAFEREKGSQIAVLIVATVRPESIEQYALRVVEAWKLGRQGIDDGALLLVAKDDRRMRIEVGYGLEGALNDATAKRIISETIAPHFKQGGFYAGVDAGVDAMLKVVAGEPLPAPDEQGRRSADAGASFEAVLVAGGILVLIVAGAVRAILVLRAIFGRFLAAGIVAVGAGVIASLMFSSLL